MKQIDVPQIWQHLPFHRGYPVPYFVHWDGAVPNFHLADPKKWVTCLKYRKCWVCGKALRTAAPIDALFMITGPKGLANRVGTDTFMHEACARESIRLCPDMHYQKADRREVDAANIATNPHHDPNKPLEIALVRAGAWQVINTGYSAAINYQPLAVQWFHYVDGLLVAKDETLLRVDSTGWKVTGFKVIPISKL